MQTYQSIDDLREVIDDQCLADLVLDYYKEIIKVQEFPKKSSASIKPDDDTVESNRKSPQKFYKIFINWRDGELREQDLLNVYQRTTAPIELLENLQTKRLNLRVTSLELEGIFRTEKKSILKYSIEFNELSLNVTNNWNNTQLIL